MREIKIRVFNTETKEMIYFHSLAMTEDGCSISAHQTNNDQHDWIDTWIGRLNDKCIFMEYTDLKDKNGKEIYEGDFVYLTNWNAGVDKDGWKIYPDAWLVEYFDFAYHFNPQISKGKINRDVYIPSLSEPSVDQIEIIGNSYENPELLKV